jgi:hypothetical protein
MDNVNGNRQVTHVPDHVGEQYDVVLARLHHVLRPCSYLEIGVSTGETLRLATCDSIGVDPTLNITSNVIGSKPRCFFYQ